MRGMLRRMLGTGGERRDAIWPDSFGMPTAPGAPAVTPRAAEGLSAVLGCVQAIAGSIAALPVRVYRREAGRRIEVEDGPLVDLTRAPNDHQTWPELVETILGDAVLRGNAVAELRTDSRGTPVAVLPVPWPAVMPMLLPSGSVAFDVHPIAPWAGVGAPRRLLAREALHVRDRGDHPYLGAARIARAAPALANLLALQDWSTAAWQNGARPSAVVEMPGKFPDDKVAARIRASLERLYSGTANAFRIGVLELGMKLKEFTGTLADAEALESRRFGTEEVCRIFGVPPQIVADHSRSTFTNSETAGRWFAVNTLAPWCRKFEAAWQRSVIGVNDPHTLEIDLSGLLRGDDQTRWASWKIAVEAGILDPDEVRAEEGWSPRTDSSGTGVT